MGDLEVPMLDKNPQKKLGIYKGINFYGLKIIFLKKLNLYFKKKFIGKF